MRKNIKPTLALPPKTLAVFNKLTNPSRYKLLKEQAQTLFETVLMDLLVHMSLIPTSTSMEDLKNILCDLQINPIISEKRENPYFLALSISFYLFQLSLSASKIFFNQKGKHLNQAVKSINSEDCIDINESLPTHVMQTMDDICHATATIVIDTLLKHVAPPDTIDLPLLKTSLQETLTLSLQTIHLNPRSMKSLLHIIIHYYLNHHATMETISSENTKKEYRSLQVILDTWHQKNIPAKQLHRINLHPLGNQLLNNIPGATPRLIFGYISQFIALLRYSYFIPLLAYLLHQADIVTITPQHLSIRYWLGGDSNLGLLFIATITLAAVLGKRFQRAATNAQTTFQRKIENDLKNAFVFNRKLVAVSKTKAIVVFQSKDTLPLHIERALWDKYNQDKPHRLLLKDTPEKKLTREQASEAESNTKQEIIALPEKHYPWNRNGILSGVIFLGMIKHLGNGSVSIATWKHILEQGRFSIERTSHDRNKEHGTHKVKPFGRNPARLFLRLKETDIPASIPKVPYYVATSSRASHV